MAKMVIIETVGGDKGVLGLKQTEKTKQHIREINIAKIQKKYNMKCWCYNLDTKIKYKLDHLYEIENIIKEPIRKCNIERLVNSDKCNNIHRFIFANNEENLQNKLNYLNNKELVNKKYIVKLTEEQRRKQRIGLAKYIYCQYDLNMNLIEKYYLNDVIINFSKQLSYILRNQQCEKPKQIDNYYWVKKQINKQDNV